MNIAMRTSRCAMALVVIGAALCGAGAAGAAVLDLTSRNASGFVNGAYFQQIDPSSTGSGVINSFLRIRKNGAEHGYNSDHRNVEFDEENTSTYNHSLLLSAIPLVTLGGVQYREFLLDINETTPSRTISLDKLEIYLLASGNRTNYSSFGTPIYSLDTSQSDNWIKLDYSLNSGSGSGDMFAYIPNSLFTGPNQFVCLYSKFGVNQDSSDGFEEWATRELSVPTPEPSSLVSVFGGLIGFGAFVARRRRG